MIFYIGMEEMYLGIMNEQDKENDLETDELFDKLLNSIPKNNRKFVQNQLELIYDEFMSMLLILMRNIIEMDSVMVLKLLQGVWGIVRNRRANRSAISYLFS